MRGVGITGTEVNPATREYEICYRCHADSTNKPVPITTRQIAQTNVRLEFATTNPSYHPVEGIGKNLNVPSLTGAPAGLNTSSIIACTDCHNNSAGPKAGGVGPNGPHGSAFAPLLVRQYVTADPNTESASAYALCYNCHSRTSILGDQSFSDHNKHIVGERSACSVCHDPHGISAAQGNVTNNSKLINFDRSVVLPLSGVTNTPRFESTGTFRGRCYLSCHGKNHNPESY